MIGDDRIARQRARRSALIERSGAQREQLAAGWSGLGSPIAFVDRGIGVVRFLRDNPVIVGAGVALAVGLRLRRVRGWAARGLAAARLARSVARYLPLVRRFAARGKD